MTLKLDLKVEELVDYWGENVPGRRNNISLGVVSQGIESPT